MKRLLRLLILIFIAAAVLGGVAMVCVYEHIDDVGASLTVTAEQSGSADCIIVLGAGVAGNRPSLSLAKRLDKALEVYGRGEITKIIVSGDHGSKNYDEVNVMRDWLVERGVPTENIFMDHAGFSTYESIYRARDIFGVKAAVVVTQELHLSRALYIAKKLGVECRGVVADNSTNTSTLQQSIREYPARLKAFLECDIIHPKPTYLGEAIPISGNGIITEG